MWACLFFVLLFRTAVLSSLPNPTNVTFTSVNFRNILKWSPGQDTPAETKYRVHYAVYGDKEKRVWRSVQHCSAITRTWCDLSKETSDLKHGYYAKVQAVRRKNNSDWVWTQRFYPKMDTEFGAPSVSVKVEDKYVVVTVEGPMRYHVHNETSQVSMATLYPEMTYNLSVSRSGQIHHLTLTRNQYKYRIMNHETEICFSARTQLTYMPSKHQSSEWHCIATPEVPLIDRLERIVIISTAVPAVLLCLLAAGSYVLHKYLQGTDQKSPVILNKPTFFSPPLPLPTENINIIVMHVSKDDRPCPKLPNPSPASQRREAPPLVDAPGNLEDDYGFVNCSEDVGLRNVNNQDYKAKEWQIVAKSGKNYASQNPVLQSLSSSVNPVLPNRCRENLHGISLCENTETGPLQVLFQETESLNDNEGEIAVSSGYASQNVQPSNRLHGLQDDYGLVSFSSYASQNAHSAQPIDQSDVLSDDYGIVGVGTAQEEEEEEEKEEEEDLDCLQINWNHSTRKFVIPGLNFGIGQGEGESSPRGRVHLDTVYVRQPSEEEALLGGESPGSGQWEADQFMVKWDLVLLND